MCNMRDHGGIRHVTVAFLDVVDVGSKYHYKRIIMGVPDLSLLCMLK